MWIGFVQDSLLGQSCSSDLYPFQDLLLCRLPARTTFPTFAQPRRRRDDLGAKHPPRISSYEWMRIRGQVTKMKWALPCCDETYIKCLRGGKHKASRTGIRTRSGRHPVASKLHRSVWRKRDLQDLICESSFFFEIRQNEVKKALLTLEVQASRSINTDEARVKGNICIDSLATRLLRRSPKVDTVVRDERPIAIENCGFQLPILLPSKTEMIDVRAHESLVSSQPDQTRAEIFIDQQFLHA